jgi:hypothetical protein
MTNYLLTNQDDVQVAYIDVPNCYDWAKCEIKEDYCHNIRDKRTCLKYARKKAELEPLKTDIIRIFDPKSIDPESEFPYGTYAETSWRIILEKNGEDIGIKIVPCHPKEEENPPKNNYFVSLDDAINVGNKICALLGIPRIEDSVPDYYSTLFYSIGGNGKKEALMDYCLAYTIKMCGNRYKVIRGNNSIRDLYCNKILSVLIGETIPNNAGIRVYPYFQSTTSKGNVIDFIAEIYINNDYHVIIIEDKIEGEKHNNLNDYKEFFEKHYKELDEDKNKVKLHFYVIKAGCENDYRDWAKNGGFNFYTLDEIRQKVGFKNSNNNWNKVKDTGDTIFDEFWLRDW